MDVKSAFIQHETQSVNATIRITLNELFEQAVKSTLSGNLLGSSEVELKRVDKDKGKEKVEELIQIEPQIQPSLFQP